MNRAARNVLRRIGHDPEIEDERKQHAESDARPAKQEEGAQTENSALADVPDEMLTDTELRHEQYRRRQAMGGKFAPAAERLPIMTAEEREARDKNRPKWRQTEFEGPIEKLIEKYGDLAEVEKHLTLGQSMKYEFTEDGQVLDKEGNTIFDGEKIVSARKP